MGVRVLVVGGGAREHALVWKLHQSPRLTAVYAAPGNAGISLLAHTFPTSVDDFAGLQGIVRANQIDLTIVGPEGPLADGIVDSFQAAGLRIFGPTRAAARIEWSKAWAKDLMARHGIPTGRWATASDPDRAWASAEEYGVPVVLKADGLAGGKGAVVCRSMDEVEETLDDFLVRRIHGESGRTVVVEEFLRGTELSVFALADGKRALPLIGARDYKQLADGDLGPMTGGMGGYAPPGYATPELMDRIRDEILDPTVRALAAEGAPYTGVLFAGLMITEDGPRVLEFNSRWGDPEAELVFPLLKSDILDLMDACLDGHLADLQVEWHAGAACGVVLAARGYPTIPSMGAKITGLEELEDGVRVFHGATRLLKAETRQGGWLKRTLVGGPIAQDTGLVTDGGRVLTVVATGNSVAEARARVYENVGRIQFDGMQYRRDLGEVDPTLAEVWLGASNREPEAARAVEGTIPDPSTAEGPPSAAEADASASSETTQTQPGIARTEAAGDATKPLVAVLMGSESDRQVMDEAVKALENVGIPSETHVMSAHRTPERVRQFARGAEARGIQVIIAGAGFAAALPGVVAAQTTLPVIGVPLAGSSLLGLDSLLSIAQMPGGVPVATVAIGTGGARNAAYLAAAIIGLANADVRARYKKFRNDQSGGELE